MHKDQLDVKGQIVHLAYEIHELTITIRILEDHVLKDQILSVIERKTKELQALTKKL